MNGPQGLSGVSCKHRSDAKKRIESPCGPEYCSPRAFYEADSV